MPRTGRQTPAAASLCTGPGTGVRGAAALGLMLTGPRRLQPGDLLVAEEPETHLSPNGQVAMLDILARLARAGIRVVATTHSAWMTERLTSVVMQGEMDPCGKFPTAADTGVWHFRQGPDGSTVEEVPFDWDGSYTPADTEAEWERNHARTEWLCRTGQRSQGDADPCG